MQKKILITTLLLALSVGIYFLFFNKTDEDKNLFSNIVENIQSGDTLLIKNLPIDISAYDEDTKMAGDMKFSNMKLEFDVMYYDYGFVIPSTELGGEKSNPQPTFIAPLGTEVKSIVDGVVIDIPTLYSNDYSIMVAKSENSNMVYELEHVINPKVKVGDTVKAGDIVAEVSDYDSRNTPGYGLVEIGILIGGNPPHHVCPYLYLDPQNEDEIFSTLKQLYEDWNAFKGEEIYKLSDYNTIGCLSEDKIDG